MIKVIHLIDTGKICGPGKTILESITGYDSAQYRAYLGLYLRNDETENAYYRAAESREVEVVPIRSSHQFDPCLVFSTVAEIKRLRIDLVLTHGYKADIIGIVAAKMSGVPVISTAHGWITNNRKSKVYMTLQSWALRHANGVIAVSPSIKQILLGMKVPEKNIELIYNGIVMDKYDPVKTESFNLRNRFSIPDNTVIIGYVGRLSPEKGQKDFITAMSRIIDERPDVHCVFVGDGPSKGELMAYAVELGIDKHIHVTGHLTNVAPIYKDIDLFALTSLTEGFPNVVLEALCMDVPVLATDVGGVSSIVRPGKTGILVKAGDISAIVSGMLELISDDQKAASYARNGKKMVYEHFRFEARLQRVQDYYQKVLSESA